MDEAPPDSIFIAPSIDVPRLLSGQSYSYHSPIPQVLADDNTIECVLGVDEAGRGPVLGPMVYALLYLPLSSHRSLLAETHHFDDSKVLTPQVRSNLMQSLCTPSTSLYQSCGWATKALSPRDISAGMLKPGILYNLNKQAMDATIELIKEVFARGVNVKEIYIDTIGPPQAYQTKLSRIFPTTAITVAKKADSLYPCVSAASVCAKVTRDAALEVCYRAYTSTPLPGSETPTAASSEAGWGSGYPSDARCSGWIKRTMDPVFGWGNVCRFSWGTAKELLETKGGAVKVDWPLQDDDEETTHVTDYFAPSGGGEGSKDEMANWFGTRVGEEVF
ncbi:hypothetical protein FGG08_003662 [Glutinoglossum americanum]|uniref:Ribonuclease n=1 Tax=Glutinoglossum americanum TaxID=1670608 RepID=A0A9P8HXS5_9PEZI|nr:hypothetical protein FGG08_003662 [Glutinoglossum americanum]